MPTLAESLGTTAHCSVLRRKARRLGVETLDQAIALAAERGCRHYRHVVDAAAPAISRDRLPDDELVTLLLLSGQPYQPMAVRAAAQLARSPHVRAGRLAMLARRERTGRILAHIAHAGRKHDPSGHSFWTAVITGLGHGPERDEPTLPHWSRFVSMPGIQRGGETHPPVWLVPSL